MILALDVAYDDLTGIVGMVEFETWSAEEAGYRGTIHTRVKSEYVPGEFYKRELPCLLKALTFRKGAYECIVVDGFVHLEGKGRKGLGLHLYRAMRGRTPVVGVAKNSLKTAKQYISVFRGRSRKPLYVSAVGMGTVAAAARIKGMAGAYRIPRMLKLVDQLTKGSRKMDAIRPTTESDLNTIFSIINDAARAYKGIIPADRWHEPYMSLAELKHEISAGVIFWGLERDGRLMGVMGIQDKGEVVLIRHAYVRTQSRNQGIGATLLRHLEKMTDKPILIGTWADATWAVSFYEKSGYRLVTKEEKNRLLKKYWSIPERQIETSVVLIKNKTS
jgi:deoxyinosine 3'endonuclease (endonuclease V)/N-acetylglutamate synthase-like GNAT family acetyltransferase